jgi:hypothetical protein
MNDDDPNEAYEVLPIEPGLRGPAGRLVDRQTERHACENTFPAWGLGRAFSPAFRAGSLYPFGAWVPKNLPRRRMVSAARCCSTGSGRLDLDLGLLICGPRVNLFYQPHTRASVATG